jgi:hypothetical protein
MVGCQWWVANGGGDYSHTWKEAMLVINNSRQKVELMKFGTVAMKLRVH